MGVYVECTVECRIESTTVNTNKQRCVFAFFFAHWRFCDSQQFEGYFF